MSSQKYTIPLSVEQIYPLLLKLQEQEVITRTFRRLDPPRQQAIIDAILAEAAVSGPAVINIKNVAARSGVAVGSLYQYFGNREGLINFSIELVTRQVCETFNYIQPWLADMPLREGLLAYIKGGEDWSETQTSFVRFFAAAAYNQNAEMQQRVVRPVAETMLDIVRQMLAAAVERGEARADLDQEAAARLLHGMSIILGDSQILPYLNAYFQTSDECVAWQRVMDVFLDVLTHGILVANQINDENLGVETRE
ncbi:MAG: TetR/AcrR family transcriptional regulator [Anaerolineaceae bacterium]|nr:TetR/AcrR family transcriptional regulator [Anaerolineaceae bacterium]